VLLTWDNRGVEVLTRPRPQNPGGCTTPSGRSSEDAAVHVVPVRSAACRAAWGRRSPASTREPARTRFAQTGRPIQPSPTTPIPGIAAPYPAAGRSCRRTRKAQPAWSGTFIIPNGGGITVPADGAGRAVRPYKDKARAS